jgi:hypothetical protein
MSNTGPQVFSNVVEELLRYTPREHDPRDRPAPAHESGSQAATTLPRGAGFAADFDVRNGRSQRQTPPRLS